MDYFDLIQARRSVRAFREDPIEPKKLDQLLSAANLAPSAGNLQAYEVYLVTQFEAKRALTVAAGEQDFVAQAPAVLVFCANPERSSIKYGVRGARVYSVQDATIACAYAMLAATALGLASVWVGAFDEEEARRAIGAPRGLVPLAILPIGYAAEEPGPTSRRPIRDIVHRVK